MNTCKKCNGSLPDGAIYCPWCGKSLAPPKQRKRGNGQGTAYKRGKGWEAARPGYTYTDENGYHRVRPRKGGFATKREALEWASQKTVKPEHSPKLIELWQLYQDNDLPKLSKDKQTGYKVARKRLEPLMATEIHLLTLEAIQNTINAACDSYYKARDCKTVLSKLYQKAMASNSGLVVKNLAEFVVLPELKEKEATPFTQDELTTFWTMYDKGDPFVGYILLMCYSGMMPAELLACKKDMIDLQACEIFGCGAKTKNRKKSAIVFPEILRPVVESLLTSKGDKLLPINKDNFYIEYYACLDRAAVRKLVPYSCRHTYGTEAVKLGVHPAVIQKMLRHSNTKTQERYTHLTSGEAHDAVNLFQRGTQLAHTEGSKP